MELFIGLVGHSAQAPPVFVESQIVAEVMGVDESHVLFEQFPSEQLLLLAVGPVESLLVELPLGTIQAEERDEDRRKRIHVFWCACSYSIQKRNRD